MAHHNYLIGHNTSPDRNKTNPSRLTALTPQNQPERPLLRGNQKLLGVRPTKNVAPQWKKTKELIAGAAKGMPEGYEKRWYRLLFAYPSNYVHIRDASQAQEPTLAYVVGSSQSSVLMTMQVAMEICRDRRLGSCQTTQAADDIVALCQSLPGVEVPD